MREQLRPLGLVVLAVVMVACDGGTTPADGGGLDGSTIDSGPSTDGAVEDGSRPDGSPSDGAAADGGDGGDEPLDAGPGPIDGGPVAGCSTDADCDESAYCERPTGTCADRGACAERPMICLPVVAEVCGCDGRTYNSECDARSMGMNVAAEGACGGTCELRPRGDCCFADTQCARFQRCVGESCTGGGEGTCVSNRLVRGQCWEDSDCDDGVACVGADRCPCGVACLLPDSPGRCGGLPTE